MKKISILILTLLVAMAACKKVPEVNKEYVDVERDLITVGTTTATIQCDYEYIATLKKAFLYYGEGEDAVDMNVAEMSVVQKTLYTELGGLKGNTSYSYYYEFVNGFNSMKSAVKTFKTEASPTTVTLPTVVTAEVTEITVNSAKGGGEVTNDGGAEVTERGICWSTNANPTLTDNHIAAGTGIGAFIAEIEGLQANTTYHVRAYAINEKGTAYGLDMEFTTLGGGGSGASEGALSGMFSVAPDRTVNFSQGNLQYQASTNTWRFAENQWNQVGGNYLGLELGNVYENGVKCDNRLASSTYSGWIDMFCWGTSGWDCGNVYYQPYDIVEEGTGYEGALIGPPGHFSLDGVYANSDWGVYNAISNGGNQPGLWRTLSMEEWDYIMNYRDQASEKYSLATVNGVHGCVLLPDEWICPSGLVFVPQSFNWNINVYTEQQWMQMEENGAVFLPASGAKASNFMNNSGTCEYHTIDSYSDWSSVHFMIGDNGFVGDTGYTRTLAISVRLVQDVNEVIFPPTVITTDVSNITSTSASCGGEVTNDGGAEVTERGICWSTNANPTLNDNHVTAGTGTGSFTAAMNGLEANTTYHVRAYATNEVGTAYGQELEFTALQGGGSGEHEYVDLGLPSGTLWATCNVGANAPEEYGDYFAWGEIEPKDTYNWATYKYCNGESNQLTKYCDSASFGYNGFTDNLTALLPEDDAATANWGNGWRMPTLNEWNELFVNTTHTWTTQNGVKGCLFTASNGNSLFLPAAGYRYYDALNLAGICGYYWLSLLYTERPYDAWAFTLYNWGDYPIHSDDRINGRSVRPVRSVPQN